VLLFVGKKFWSWLEELAGDGEEDAAATIQL
jgi:hypothetical protein